MSGQKIGAMMQRAELQVKQADGSWQTQASLWANIRDMRGNELLEGEGLVQRKQVQLIIRWRDDVHAGMRFLASGRVLDIVSALDRSGRRRFLHCLCEEEPDRNE